MTKLEFHKWLNEKQHSWSLTRKNRQLSHLLLVALVMKQLIDWVRMIDDSWRGYISDTF